MPSPKSKELKARKKLEKAFTEWFIAKLQSNAIEAEKKIKNKLTPEEWEQLNRGLDEIAEEMIEALKKNPNSNPLSVAQNFVKKLQRQPIYEKLLDKFEYKTLKENLQRARKRKPHYIN